MSVVRNAVDRDPDRKFEVSGRGPAVSSTEATSSIHAPIVNEVLEHKGEDRPVLTKDKVTLFYLGSEKDQVVDAQNRSIERTIRSG